MPSFLEDPHLRLLFFGGKGGGGKTTCATATALRYARRWPQRSFLLVSTDPAHSLADSLADLQPPANLKILEFNAQESLESFKARHRHKLEEIAARGTFLDEGDIRQFLDLSLPGMDELMALLRIASWAQTRNYDLIIVDTAPTGHTLRLLTMPALIRNWLRALDALLAKHRFMQLRFRGAYQPDELDHFLVGLAASVAQMEGLLRDRRRSRFVPVTLAEEVVISETLKLLKELEGRKIPVTEIVVNGLYPDNSCALCAEGRRRQWQTLRNFWNTGRVAGYRLWGVPLCPEEVRGQGLKTFWEGVSELSKAASTLAPPPLELPPRVEAPPPCPSAGLTFLIFAGKGGVGKTTLACATAVRLAQEFPGKENFLFSTDPAHSLAACLKARLDTEPVGICPGLTAMEMDAPGEFAALKRHYQQELERFLKSACQHIDFPFDREVLERLLDLAPPGLDEIMALMRAMEFLAQGRYDVFILDSAPTGHLLRLLELPELIDQWLKTFFGLFLKYQLAFRFPDLSQQMVRLSRNLKLLRSLWRDPARAAVYVVSILTEMAFQETQDLMQACARLGINVPVLFLNQATPAGDCSLCSALHRRESRLADKFRQAFPGQHQALIFRQGEPRGSTRLRQLGRALYLSTEMEKHHGAMADMPALSS